MQDIRPEPDEFLDESEADGRSNKTRLVILVLVVGLALGYMVYAAFPGNALYFMSVSEFMNREEAQDGRIVRVSGKLVDGSFHREGTSTLARFQLVDENIADQNTEVSTGKLTASYVGVVPDLFFNPHSEIILEGSVGEDHVFLANNILVKCPSKYKDEGKSDEDSWKNYDEEKKKAKGQPVPVEK